VAEQNAALKAESGSEAEDAIFRKMLQEMNAEEPKAGTASFFALFEKLKQARVIQQ